MLDWQLSTYVIFWMLSGVIGLLIFVLALKIEYGNGILFDPMQKPIYLLIYPVLGGILFITSIGFLLMILAGKVKYFFNERG